MCKVAPLQKANRRGRRKREWVFGDMFVIVRSSIAASDTVVLASRARVCVGTVPTAHPHPHPSAAFRTDPLEQDQISPVTDGQI